MVLLRFRLVLRLRLAHATTLGKSGFKKESLNWLITGMLYSASTRGLATFLLISVLPCNADEASRGSYYWRPLPVR